VNFPKETKMTKFHTISIQTIFLFSFEKSYPLSVYLKLYSKKISELFLNLCLKYYFYHSEERYCF